MTRSRLLDPSSCSFSVFGPCRRRSLDRSLGQVAGLEKESRRPFVGKDSWFWSSCRLAFVATPNHTARKGNRSKSLTPAAADVLKNVFTTGGPRFKPAVLHWALRRHSLLASTRRWSGWHGFQDCGQLDHDRGLLVATARGQAARSPRHCSGRPRPYQPKIVAGLPFAEALGSMGMGR